MVSESRPRDELLISQRVVTYLLRDFMFNDTLCVFFQTCEKCNSEVDGALRSVIQELEQLTMLLSGSHTDQSLQSQLRGEERDGADAAYWIMWALTSATTRVRNDNFCLVLTWNTHFVIQF